MELGAALGISSAAVNKAKKSEIPPGWIVTISQKFGVSADWLLYGKGAMYDLTRINIEQAQAGTLQAGGYLATVVGKEEAGNARKIYLGEDLQWMPAEAAPSMGYALVPKVMARLAAGTGSLETEGKVIGYYAFKLDFLRRKGRPKEMVLMEVAGDSMEPDVWNGDTVLIDESQREIIAGAMFAVGIENEVFVKYLLRVPGKLILQSRNERYAPIEVDMNGDIVGTVRVIGRVVWSCREYVR